MKGKYGYFTSQSSGKIKRIVTTGLLFALALVFTGIESAIPLPVPVPGIRFGLANIIVMYSLFFLTKTDAAALVLLKSVFVFATRGVAAGVLSFCGGTLSYLVIILLMAVFKEKISYLLISIFGAIFHNIGQYLAVYMIYRVWLYPYLPVLIIVGIIAGMVTSVLLKTILPILRKI